MSDIAIKFENISKQYRLGNIGTGTLSHDLNRWWAMNIRGKDDPNLKIGQVNDRAAKATSDYIWALRDIDFEVKKGEVLGIIGKNGAGKSTLLKILSRVTSPTTGRIMAHGRIASLLEVGTGFHPEMTGRENIYMNGAIMGMTKAEITRKLDEIIDFAGVEKYIDTPVKRYSSGMTVRLGFAIAAHLEPEILVVDEVLAVGDAEFQKKAIGKMQDVSRTDGRTVLFVSHNMGSISQLCTKAIVLDQGGISHNGETQDIINYYLDNSFSKNTIVSYPIINGCRGQILNVELFNSNKINVNTFKVGDRPNLKITYNINQKVKNFHIALILTDMIGNHIFSSADTDINEERLLVRDIGEYTVKTELSIDQLNVGRYNISIGMGIINSEIFDRKDSLSFNIEDLGDFGTGKEGNRRNGILLVKANWNYEL